MIKEKANPLVFKKGDSPSIGMHIGGATTCLKAGEGKADVGGDVAIHPK